MQAQDFRALRDPRPVDPQAKLQLTPMGSAPLTVRVLLAGDSWAQYMWDDGSHNDLFDKFGHQDKRALSISLDDDPGPGYTGTGYAVSGSEARQWVDTANYPWIANLNAAIAANPDVDLVLLSIGGNDALAGKSDGGWYKDMDLDVPGSEDAFFDQLEDDTMQIVDTILAQRAGMRVVLSSYDYPNFNVGFWCFVYACPKRDDLSRDPGGDPITDQELNQMMVTIETIRLGWVNNEPRLLFDHAVGLMHHHYGDGQTGPGLLPFPGQDGPDYLPFPGGNIVRPTLRSNFRVPLVDADPIHLDAEGYQVKISSQIQTHFFPEFRGTFTESFASEGGTRDGWTDGTTVSTTGIRVGQDPAGAPVGLVSFDTGTIPDGATVQSASLYLIRTAGQGTSPFQSGALGTAQLDVATGSFGAPSVEASDPGAAATALDVADVAGSARSNGYAVRFDLDASGLAALNDTGITQFRISFPGAGASGPDAVTFAVGGTSPVSYALPTLADYMGSAGPFLDVAYTVPTTVPGQPTVAVLPLLSPATPNPVRGSTSLPFVTGATGHVRLTLFDVRGRVVRTLIDEVRGAGAHTLTWDARDDRGQRVAPGVYLARLVAEGRSRTQRLVVLGR